MPFLRLLPARPATRNRFLRKVGHKFTSTGQNTSDIDLNVNSKLNCGEEEEEEEVNVRSKPNEHPHPFTLNSFSSFHSHRSLSYILLAQPGLLPNIVTLECPKFSSSSTTSAGSWCVIRSSASILELTLTHIL